MDPRKYLTGQALADYDDYVALRNRAMHEGWHHWMRIGAVRSQLQVPDINHHIVWTPPYEPDAPMAITTPAPHFIAELMHGGVHPPIDAFHQQRLLVKGQDGVVAQITRLEAPRWYQDHGGTEFEVVIDNRRCHLERAPAMTYEQAIEFVVLKDIPQDVWASQKNERQFAIVPRSAVPKDRTHRNAWKLNQFLEAA